MTFEHRSAYTHCATPKEVRPGEKILLPAILGIKPETFADFATQLGVPVGEIPLPPPSIPGRRINDALTQMCRDARIDIQLNSVATGFQNFGKRVTAVEVQRAGRKTNVKVDFVIDGAGGFESGNLTRDSHLRIRESVFNLPLYTPKAPEPDFAAENIFRTGVLVNAKMNPIDADGKLQYENLYCVGSILGGALAWEEKSGEGISLGSAYTAAQAIISSALAKNPGTAAESSANAANKEDN
ncbi:FAD-binding protein [Arcanobacterium hippocoleae]|uniref:FAD-binding protein n=1 Tax=Arcanobacterium hippocoleae TaxID=149017 RepID=UPI00333F4DDA